MSYASTNSFFPSRIPLPASTAGISSGYSSGYYNPSATSSQETRTLEEIRTLVDGILTALSNFQTANSSSHTVSELTDRLQFENETDATFLQGETPLSGPPTISSLQTDISGYTDSSLASPRARPDVQRGAFDATANPSCQQAIEIVRGMRLDPDEVKARCRSYLEDPRQGIDHGFGDADKARGALNDPAFWLYLARPTSQLSSRMKRRLNGQRADRLTVADLSASAWTVIRGLPQDDAGSRAPSIATTESLPAEPSLAAADLASPPSAVVLDPEQREVQQEDDTFSALPFPGNADEVEEVFDAARNGLGDDHHDDGDQHDDADGQYEDDAARA
ncbi:hypothetical protein HD553DRAFT_316361 [Filobasidium floriforme]|uniref:uncharacterized protein n=1 Tax=Filobasidium floriforme TaxID=5210 RepID=UPI001E8CEF04|nr:uncharacterized protein HD553DRAFT_316361 [Filobasidium floriforme]KAH8080802.1 hypothetical protein HD553DRAFT_316361 [Filobasidium floriforme]